MKRSSLVFFMMFSFELAFGFCRSSGVEVVGSFELVKTEFGEMKCSSDLGGKLRLPGCVASFKKLDSKNGEAKEFRTYLNPELCDAKVGDVREMKILSLCCDYLLDVKCNDFSGGVFTHPLSDVTLACNAGIYFSVFQYKSVKAERIVVRQYNDQMKAFEDTKLKSIQPSPKAPKTPAGKKPNRLMHPFGS